MLPFVLALALLQEPDDAIRAAVEKGVTLPAAEEIEGWAKKGEHYKRAVAIVVDRANWARAVAALAARTGLWKGTLEIRVAFRELKEHPAMGNGAAGKGEIAFDIEKLAKYQKSIMDYERLKEKTVVVVPPARPELILHHELTHCFQSLKQPLWFLEGIATYVAGDGHFVAFFKHDGVKVREVDAEYEHRHLYARGWAFLEFVRARHGEEAVRKLAGLAMAEGKPLEQSAAEATGTAWEALRAQEREWSAKWIAAYKVRK